ncbi:MAG: hypothetical protein OEX02_17530 [Cyclobacteriaceae bacterium]|nr:hypothetical protein [Cyclobacteriaceae bacterium]
MKQLIITLFDILQFIEDADLFFELGLHLMEHRLYFTGLLFTMGLLSIFRFGVSGARTKYCYGRILLLFNGFMTFRFTLTYQDTMKSARYLFHYNDRSVGVAYDFFLKLKGVL